VSEPGVQDDQAVWRFPGCHGTGGTGAADVLFRCPAATDRYRRDPRDVGGLPVGRRRRGYRDSGQPRRADPRPGFTNGAPGDGKPPRAGPTDRRGARFGGWPGHVVVIHGGAGNGAAGLVLCQYPGQPGADRGDEPGCGRPARSDLAGRSRAGGGPRAAERLPALRAEHRPPDTAYRRSPRRCPGNLSGRVDRRRDRRGGRLQPAELAVRAADS